MRPLPLRALVLALLLPVGCSRPRTQSAVVEAPDLIARHEIAAAKVQTVYELVERLHPLWLQKRGTNRIQREDDIVVYLDNARLGGPETLRQIQAANVTSVRFFDAARAQYRFGMGHMSGAILVSTGAQ